MKQQVLMTMASASASSSTMVYPLSDNSPSIFSLSTRFLSQPKEINNTFFIYSFILNAASTQLCISMAMVIGPTPPGTGVIALTLSITLS